MIYQLRYSDRSVDQNDDAGARRADREKSRTTSSRGDEPGQRAARLMAEELNEPDFSRSG